jgi:Tfp pilus assembly protein PilF
MKKKVSKVLSVLLALALVPALFYASGCAKKETRSWIEKWAENTPMQKKRAGVAAIAIGKRLYAIGGGEFSAEGLMIFDSVEYSDAQPDGRLGPWQYGPSLKVPRIYAPAVVHGDYIYVVGGESSTGLFKGVEFGPAPKLLDTVERARINPDGSIGEWTLEPGKMAFPRRGGVVFAHNGWLYAGGGFSGDFLNDMERAKINPDGSLGQWEEENFINRDRYIAGFAQVGNKFLVLGGHVNGPARAMDSVETAEAGPDGRLSEWKEGAPLHTKTFLNAVAMKDKTIFSLTGQNTINLTAVQRATIGPDGTLSAWTPDTRTNAARRAASAAVIGDTIYLIGGMVKPLGSSDSVNVVESALIREGQKLGTWVEPGSDAEKRYKEWAKATPQDAVNHVRRGAFYLEHKEYETVMFDVDEALREAPRYADAYNLKAEVALRQGDKAGAEAALNKSLEAEDNFVAHMNLGFMSFEKGDFNASAEHFRKAVAKKPDSIDAHYNLGNSYMSAKDYQSATAEFRWMVEKDPNSDEARHLLKMAEGAEKAGK